MKNLGNKLKAVSSDDPGQERPKSREFRIKGNNMVSASQEKINSLPSGEDKAKAGKNKTVNMENAYALTKKQIND